MYLGSSFTAYELHRDNKSDDAHNPDEDSGTYMPRVDAREL